ncbi:MAG: hypothetical protein RLZZ458_825 [Planctomycetota bacterium]|jgi:hypothetical protein
MTAWLLAFWPAAWAYGQHGVVWMSIAAGVAFVSGLAGLVLIPSLVAPDSLAQPLLHMANRAFWVIAASAAAKTFQPGLRFTEFYGWLLLFYIILMVLEVVGLRKAIRTGGQ